MRTIGFALVPALFVALPTLRSRIAFLGALAAVVGAAFLALAPTRYVADAADQWREDPLSTLGTHVHDLVRAVGELALNAPRDRVPDVLAELYPLLGVLALVPLVTGAWLLRGRAPVAMTFVGSVGVILFAWPFVDSRLLLPDRAVPARLRRPGRPHVRRTPARRRRARLGRGLRRLRRRRARRLAADHVRRRPVPGGVQRAAAADLPVRVGQRAARGRSRAEVALGAEALRAQGGRRAGIRAEAVTGTHDVRRRGGSRAVIGVSLIGKAAEGLTLVVLVVLMPRVLGPADYGDFAVALSTVTLVAAALALGGPTLLSRFVPVEAIDARRRTARAIGERFLRVRVIQSGIVVAAAVMLVAVAPERFPATVTALVAAAVLLDSMATLGFQVVLGLSGTTLWSFRYPLQNAIVCGAGLVLYGVAGVTGAIAGITLGAAATALVATVAVVGRLRGVPPAPTLPDGVIRFAFVQTVSGFFLQLVQRGTVIAVVLLASSSTEAGFAALASGVALAASYVVWQAFVVELPALAARYDEATEDVEQSVRRLTWLSTIVMIPVGVVGVLVVDEGLPRVVGSGFADAAPAFAPALAILPFAGLTAAATQLSALRLRPGSRLVANAGGAIVFLVTAALAVPRWGSVGGTAALLAATAVTACLVPALLPRTYGSRLLATALGGAGVIVSLPAALGLLGA